MLVKGATDTTMFMWHHFITAHSWVRSWPNTTSINQNSTQYALVKSACMGSGPWEEIPALTQMILRQGYIIDLRDNCPCNQPSAINWNNMSLEAYSLNILGDHGTDNHNLRFSSGCQAWVQISFPSPFMGWATQDKNEAPYEDFNCVAYMNICNFLSS